MKLDLCLRRILYDKCKLGLLCVFLCIGIGIVPAIGQSCNTGCNVTISAASGADVHVNTNGRLICVRANTNININVNANNVTICVQSGRTYTGNINISGGVTGLTIDNYGTFSSTLNSTHAGMVINNRTGGTWTHNINNFLSGTLNNNGAFNATSLNIGGTAVFNQRTSGSILSSTTPTINTGATFNNFDNVSVGEIAMQGGTFNNQTTGTVIAKITFNSSSTYINSGRTTVTQTIGINGTFTNNTGSTVTFNQDVNVNGSSSLTIASGVIADFNGNLTNNSTFTTFSGFSVSGTMANNSSGTMSISGTTVSITGSVTNDGILNLTNAQLNTGTNANNAAGNINLNNSGISIAGSFTNNGRVNNLGTTCSKVTVTGTSTNHGTFGTNGRGKTDICTNGTRSFNTNTGTLRNYTICNCSLIITLPVSFIYFRGTETEKGVLLEWQTASEKDNRAFVVERSSDGKIFTDIAQLQGNGTKQGVSTYQVTDTRPQQGINYYRLRQVDFDHTESYYSKLIVINHMVSHITMTIAPNPATADYIQIQFSESVGRISLCVVDMQGKIRQKEYHANAQDVYKMQIQGLPKGVYILLTQFETDHEVHTETQRFIRL